MHVLLGAAQNEHKAATGTPRTAWLQTQRGALHTSFHTLHPHAQSSEGTPAWWDNTQTDPLGNC